MAHLLREATAAGWPVRVLRGHRGAGASPENASSAEGVHLSLERLDALHEHEPADLTATVGAGLDLERLAASLEGAGQWLPVDAPGWRTRTVGGLVAGGRWGPLHVGYGTPRDHVLGATLVTGDGRVLELGGKVVKNVAGFDLLRLVVGSRGRLGVVVRATVRLYPLPAADRTLLFTGRGARDLHALAVRLAGLPGQPASLEVLGGGVPAVAGVEGLPPGDGVVALRLAGTPGGVEALSLLAQEKAAAAPAATLADGASRAFFASVADGARGGRPWIRFSVLPSHLPELAERLVPLLGPPAEAGAEWWSTHVRAGVLRLVSPTAGAGEEGRGGDQLRRVGEWAVSVGGSVRTAGTDADAGGGSGRVRQLEEGIRRVFDPAGVMGSLPRWHP